MKKIKFVTFLASFSLLLSAMTAPLMAGGLGIGVTGTGVAWDTDGSQTLKSSSKKDVKDDVSGTGLVGSIYLQYMLGDDGWVFGVEHMPGEIVIGSSDTRRTDKLTDAAGSVVQQIAKAKAENHMGAYVETPSFGGWFLKAGWSTVDIKTLESLGTGAEYPDTDMDGYTAGIGFRGTADNGIHLKFLVEYTDYESVELKSTGSDASTTINANSETYGAKVALGYQF